MKVQTGLCVDKFVFDGFKELCRGRGCWWVRPVHLNLDLLPSWASRVGRELTVVVVPAAADDDN